MKNYEHFPRERLNTLQKTEYTVLIQRVRGFSLHFVYRVSMVRVGNVISRRIYRVALWHIQESTVRWIMHFMKFWQWQTQRIGDDVQTAEQWLNCNTVAIISLVGKWKLDLFALLTNYLKRKGRFLMSLGPGYTVL